MAVDNWENIDSTIEQQKERDKKFQADVKTKTESVKGVHKKYDSLRYSKKTELKQLLETWKAEFADSDVLKDNELLEIFGEVEKYAAMDITATHSGTIDDIESIRRKTKTVESSYLEEAKKVNNLLSRLSGYIDNLEQKAGEYTEAKDAEKPEISDEERTVATREIMAINLQTYFEHQINGYLEPVPEDSKHIRTYDKEIKYKGAGGIVDMRDKPLFPHEPSPNDINQGYIGDCYLVSSLAAAAAQHPEKLKETIRDNGDGTVTVRFFERIPPEEQPENERQDHDVMRPYYVTVDKTIPNVTGAHNCLWVSMIEKAYAASGMHITEALNENYSRAVPSDIQKQYQRYQKMPEYMRPSRRDCPWLFDEKGELKKWEVDHMSIESGDPSLFIEHLFGEKYQGTVNYMKDIRLGAAQDIVFDYMVDLIENNSNRKFANAVREMLRDQEPIKRTDNLCKIFAAVKDRAVGVGYNDLQGEINRVLSPETSVNRKAYTDFADILAETISSTMTDVSLRKENHADHIESVVKERVEKMLSTYGEKEKETADMLLKELDTGKKVLGDFVNGQQYSKAYEDIYNSIKEEIDSGNMVFAGSPNNEKGDSETIAGIVQKHSHTVLGVAEEKHNGKTYKFVILRNPHGSDLVPEYDFNTNPPTPQTSRDPEAGGVFKMELCHFLGSMSNLYYSGKELKGAEKDKYKKELGFMRKRVLLSKYDRVLSVMDKDLEKAVAKEAQTDAIKEATKNLKDLLTKMNCEINESDLRVYSNSVSRFLSENREKLNPETVRIFEATRAIADMASEGITDPAAEITSKISGMSMHMDESIYDIMDMSGKYELTEGHKLNKTEAIKVAKIFRGAESSFVKSSTQFEAVKEKLGQLHGVIDNFEKTKSAKEMSEYITKLKELAAAGKEYIDFKRKQRTVDGVFKAKSGLERRRMDSVQQIAEYAYTKGRSLEKTYTEMVVANTIINKLYPESQVEVEHKDVEKTINTKSFKNVIKGKSVEELKNLLKDENKLNDMIEKFEEEKAKNNERTQKDKDKIAKAEHEAFLRAQEEKERKIREEWEKRKEEERKEREERERQEELRRQAELERKAELERQEKLRKQEEAAKGGTQQKKEEIEEEEVDLFANAFDDDGEPEFDEGFEM